MHFFVWKRWAHHIVPMKFIEELLELVLFFHCVSRGIGRMGGSNLRLSDLKASALLAEPSSRGQK